MPFIDGDFHEPNNWDRASWAASALQEHYYETHNGNTYGDEGNEEMATALQDLLTDLHHLADRAGVDWDQISKRAEGNYTEEKEEEDGQEED